jgi:hypothetical protein
VHDQPGTGGDKGQQNVDSMPPSNAADLQRHGLTYGLGPYLRPRAGMVSRSLIRQPLRPKVRSRFDLPEAKKSSMCTALADVYGCYPVEMSEEDFQDDGSRSPSHMAGWQRVSIGLMGALFGIFGVVAIFKTENEAGVAVSLLACGVLLLIAIQGTKVQRISAGDNSIELAEIRRAETRRAVAEQAKAEAAEDPSSAQERIEHYESIDPQSRVDPSLQSAKALIYERQVQMAVMPARYDIDPIDGRSLEYDGMLQSIRGKRVLIEVRYRLPHRRLYPADVRRIRELTAAARADGTLVVSNVGPTPQAVRDLEDSRPPVNLIVWDPDSGIAPIKAALESLLKAISAA